jgi:hypothetical protein
MTTTRSNVLSDILGIVLTIPICIVGGAVYVVGRVVIRVGNVVYEGGKCIVGGLCDVNDVTVTAS